MGVRNLTVGIDLGREQPQLCYYEASSDKTITAPMKIGNENVSFGEILEEIELMNSNPTSDLTVAEEQSRRLSGEIADVLLRSMKTLGIKEPKEEVAGIVITVPKLTKPYVSLIRSVYERVGIEHGRGYLQDYNESFYYHTFYQKKELWSRNVGFFLFEDRSVSFLSLEMNQQTRPITVKPVEGMEITLANEKMLWDDQFYKMVNASLRQNIYSSIFLMGDTFDKNWAARSTALLCKGRRKVFVVDNVFARGACCAAREKVLKKQLSDYLYLGGDLVRENIGMQMVVQGTEVYYPLISAGVNWYEAEKTCECILVGEPELRFLVSGMNDRRQRSFRMELPQLPERPDKTTRLRVSISYESPNRCLIEAEDLGFGDIYPASGLVWREVMEEDK